MVRSFYDNKPMAQERALQKARVAWDDDDMDDDLEDIMASLKVCRYVTVFSAVVAPSFPPPLNSTQAPDSLFAQPQFMSQMQRAYGSSMAAPAAPALALIQPTAAAVPLPPLPRPSAAVAYHSAALASAHSVTAAASLSHSDSHSFREALQPPPALIERNHNQPASAPTGSSTADDLGSAWGITDPRTLAALKKRDAKFKGKDAARRQKEVCPLR